MFQRLISLVYLSTRLYCVIPILILTSCSGLHASTQGKGQSPAVPYEIAPMKAPFPMNDIQRPVFRNQEYDIRDFGAEQRHEIDDQLITDAIHRAIEAAYNEGGGIVIIPEGEWLTGPVHLMSNINLHVKEGAVLYFSENREDYLPVVRQRHEGVEAYNYSPMIYGKNLKNVALTGKGVLDAQGEHWWTWFEKHGPPPRAIATRVPLSRRDFGKGSGMEGMRPNFVVFWNCENVLVEGVTLNDSPMWNVHLIYSRNAIVRDITVNSLDVPNGDGTVIDSSRDVLIEYNRYETGDDAVVLKSGLNEEGLRINIPTENVVVRNFEAIDVRTGSGGVVFGSETSGGIRNVYVHDAYFEGSDRGVRFKTERGRGNVIENIYVRDIEMKDISREAININTYYTGSGVTGPSPLVRNIHLSNISIDGVPVAINLIGLPEKWLENIFLENISVVNARDGVRIDRVKHISLINVDIRSSRRAMIASNVYEFEFVDVSLADDTGEAPLLFGGTYNGAVLIGDFSRDLIEFGEGVSDDIIQDELKIQEW